MTGINPIAANPLGGDTTEALIVPEVSVTDDMAASALKAFLHACLPLIGNDNVRLGQLNRVPMPPGPNFVIYVPATRSRLATNVHTYRPDDFARDATQQTRISFFVNFYGPIAADNAQVFSTLFRDSFGCDFLRQFSAQPLWCDDGQQMPLIDESQQYETRWVIHAMLQVNPTVSTSAEFTDNVTINILEAD